MEERLKNAVKKRRIEDIELSEGLNGVSAVSVCNSIIDEVILSCVTQHEECRKSLESDTPQNSKVTPTFNVTKRLAALVADRDHWKKLYFSTKFQKAKESHARAEVQQHLDTVKHQLANLEEFCHQMGSQLAEMVWSLSQSPVAMSTFIKNDQMEAILFLLQGTLTNFIPLVSSEVDQQVSEFECRFVIALLGCASNLVACHDGRAFLAAQPYKDELVRNIANLILRNLSNVSMCAQEKLQRLSLTFIHNLILNQTTLKVVSSINNLPQKVKFLAFNEMSPFHNLAFNIWQKLEPQAKKDAPNSYDIVPEQ